MPPETTGQSGAQNAATAGWDPFAMQAQGLKLLQDWSDNLLQTFRSQVEGQQAMLTSVRTSLEAMEATLAGQEATNRAIRQSLEGYRQAVTNASALQESQVRLIEGVLGTLQETVNSQLQAAQAVSAPMAAPFKAMQDLSEQWLAAYQRLLQPPSSTGSSGT
jgi:predicted RNA-binding Zn ribbon-like protein